MLKKYGKTKNQVFVQLLIIVVGAVAALLVVPGTASAATPVACNTTASSSWSNNCTVSQGNISNMVIAIQFIVSSACGGSGLAKDGDFGPATEHAVTCFQNQNGLSNDGIVGSATWNVLEQKISFSSLDGNWEYFGVNGFAQAFRIWVPSGIWYVMYAAGKFAQMNLNPPGQ